MLKMLCKGKEIFLSGKKIRHLFYIIPIFSCEIKIFIVSLQKESVERICRKVDGSQKAILKT